MGGNCHWAKITTGRGGFQGGEILSGHREKFFAGLQCQPAFDRNALGVLIGASEIKVFPTPAAADNGEGVARRTGLVNNQTGRRAAG